MFERIDTTRIAHKKLFIATPMFGGNCTGAYTKSCIDLQKWCDKNDIEIHFYYIFNESLITRARNYCVHKFMQSDYTHMMFIDADIHFDYNDVIKMLFMCDDGTGLDILTGPYPKKGISWDNISKAVQQGLVKSGTAKLKDFGGLFAFNTVENITEFNVSNPVEIKEGGTGFMMIHRKVFEDYAEAYPELLYTPDHNDTKDFDGSQKMTAFFDCVIDKETNRYLSEDYMFSTYARKIGKRIWMCPWMKLNHIGTTVFSGDMTAVSKIKLAKKSTKNLTNLR